MTDLVERLRRLPPSPIAFGDSEADKRNRAERKEAADEIERLRDTLVNIDELVEDYADADDGQPNLAMRVMTMVRAVITPRG